MSRWLCLLAILLWALMPHGTMLTRGADGNVAFALCSGDGPVMVSIGTDGAPHHRAPAGDAHDKQPCPFAAAQPAGLAQQEGLPLAVVAALPTADPAPRAPLVLPAARAIRPESRGPPILS